MKASQLRNRLLLSLIVGIAVFLGLLLWGDFSGVAVSLRHFRWAYIPIILALTLFNYALRFLKWQFYLRLAGVTGLRLWDSLLIFFAGLAMTITPGKIGEWLKSFLLRESRGAPVARTAPIVVAERLTDGFGAILLAVAGLLLFDQGWIFILVVGALGLAVVAAFQYRPFARWSLALMARLPLLRRYTGFMESFYESAFVIFRPRPLLVATAISFVSWAGEGFAMYYVLLGLGAPNSGDLVVQGIFILAAATLAGVASLLPGGLGVVEGGVAGLCQALVGLTREASAVATLLIRICTLWFGVLIGVLALILITRRLKPRSDAAPVPSAPSLP